MPLSPREARITLWLPKMKQFLLATYVIASLLVGGFVIARNFDVLPDFGGAGVHILSGTGTKGEKNIAANNDTVIVTANPSRQYLEICKVSATNAVQFSLGVAGSASFDQGIQLNNNRPCFVSNDTNLVTGGFWGLASPSAASVSFQEF